MSGSLRGELIVWVGGALSGIFAASSGVVRAETLAHVHPGCNGALLLLICRTWITAHRFASGQRTSAQPSLRVGEQLAQGPKAPNLPTPICSSFYVTSINSEFFLLSIRSNTLLTAVICLCPSTCSSLIWPLTNEWLSGPFTCCQGPLRMLCSLCCAVKFSHDTKSVFSCGMDCKVILWNWKTQQQIGR